MPRDKKYDKIFTPFKIKHVELKNRLVKSSQWFIYLEPDGSVGNRFIKFYESIAKGGVGLIIVEEAVTDWMRGCSNIPHARLDDDKFLPGWQRLADTIHKQGAKAFVQLTHAGPSHKQVSDGIQPVAPSAIDPPSEPFLDKARELTVPEIHEIQEWWAQGALRAKKAGLDGVEIHVAHYALGNSWLSRRQNKRHDEYGCDTLENRARFGVEIMKRARELCGDDFIIGCRMSAREWGDPLGTTLEEAIEFAKMFEKAGLDYIQSSGYGYNEFWCCWLPTQMYWPEPLPSTKEFRDRIPSGAMLPEAEAIRKAVSIPVSSSNGYTYDSAAEALNKDRTDLVWMGRNLMVDPAYPKKVEEGRLEDIRPCTKCMHCLGRLWLNVPIECRWNAFMGHEYEIGDGRDFEPAKKKKKVMVVGAGPGGMEAARVAALRGHDVYLYDKNKWLGGLMPLATFIKDTGYDFDTVKPMLDWYENQLGKLSNVKINLGTEVDVNLVMKEKPDAVVLAPGSKWEVPDIPGKERKNVVTTGQLKEKSKDLLKYLGPGVMSFLSKFFLPIGKKIIILGGDLKGAEAAEFFVKRDREVVILEESDQLWNGMNLHLQLYWCPWIQARNIPVYGGVKYEEITDKGVWIRTKEGERKLIEGDTVMIIEKDNKNDDLYKALEGKVPELYLVGDGKENENAWFDGAVHQGARVGLTL
ncbi:MAG: FAD-dependent oxidoreductase [Pseudomonadota bacterium]